MKIGEFSRGVLGATCEMSAQRPVIIGWANDTPDGLRNKWGARAVLQVANGFMHLLAETLR
jgi:hypothetical protein